MRCVQKDPVSGLADDGYVDHSLEALQCNTDRHETSDHVIYIYIGFKTFFYVVRHLDSIASYLLTGLHLGFFRSWPSLYPPSSFSSVFLVLSFVSVSTSMLFWVIFLLPFSEHGRTMRNTGKK